MATNIITPNNSLDYGLHDSDDHSYLLVTEGGYIRDSSADGLTSAYSTGAYAKIIIKGSILGDGVLGYGIYCSGVGYNHITVSSTGLVESFIAIQVLGTNNTVSNDGTIYTDTSFGSGVYFYGNASGSVNNTGTISGGFAVRSEFGSVSITNSGTISSTNYAIYGESNADIVNSGSIFGDVFSKDILNLTNFGAIDGTILVSVMSDTGSVISNHGTITGAITTGTADDVIDNTGTITGLVNLRGGADTYTGGDGVDRVNGGAGDDAIDLGRGNDVYYAQIGDGKDTIDGGDGVDRYDASACTTACTIDLGAGTTGGTVNKDLLTGFENITGGSAADTLTGDDGANRIDGGMGADVINGDAGRDRLIGGTESDIITGGAGRDVITGGTIGGSIESDTFVFATGDSGTTAATRDTITDFTDHGSNAGPFATGADLIDLHLIDANIATAGDQAFSFNAVRGAAFSGTAGSLIWQQYNGFALVSGDTNGDKVADFTIQLDGTHTLFASDFVL